MPREHGVALPGSHKLALPLFAALALDDGAVIVLYHFGKQAHKVRVAGVEVAQAAGAERWH
jgi:hypothetical protein